MFTLSLYSSSAPFSMPPLHPPTTALSSSLSKLKPSYHHIKKLNQRRIRNGTCRAEFSHDAPFAVAIGACMLSSLVLPITAGPDDDSDTPIDSTDTRFAVMGIISFVPYFNWLSWVFAWLDTGKRRYAVYSLVYLFPYLRSNLSLSPEESWLPIASIVFCIIHIQLEASIKNGDILGFQLFTGAAKNLKGHQVISKEEKMKENKNLPSGEQPGKIEIPWWGVSENPSKDPEHLNEDWNDDDRRKH